MNIGDAIKLISRNRIPNDLAYGRQKTKSLLRVWFLSKILSLSLSLVFSTITAIFVSIDGES